MMRKPRAPRPGTTGESQNAPDDPGAGGGRASSGRDLVPRPRPEGRTGGSLTVFSRRAPTPARADRRDPRDPVVSTGLTDRLAERRRAGRVLLLRRLAALLALGAGAAVLVWALVFSPLLALRTADIVVSGSDGSVDAGAVQEALSDHAGTSLVRLDATALGDEVADDLVRVKSATVTRSWPHGLAVALTMRVPVAQHRTDAGYELLDGEAVVLETTDQPRPDLAEITADDDSTLTQEQVGAVAQAVGSLDEATRAQVASGSATTTGQVTLMLSGGARVVWGDGTDAALKAAVLAVLLGQPASTYDVSSPHSPTTS